MPFQIIRNDIVNVTADAIVNTANPRPVVGSGVDSAIHKAAGPSLLQARQAIGPIAVGDAAITPGFLLNARFVIHTVGPVWMDGFHGERKLLASCYRESLHLAREAGCESIAFPLISAGNYGFPRELALETAMQEISAFLRKNEMDITLVVYDRQSFAVSGQLVSSVASYIDETYIANHPVEKSAAPRNSRRRTGFSFPFRKKEADEDCAPLPCATMPCAPAPCPEASDLSHMLQHLDDGFSETLLRYIDQSGKKDSEIYKKANIDRKLFSKIRSNPGYKPSKATALAFAFALELSLEETRDFIGRAGFALSHSSKFDVIVEYFLIQHNYNVFELNEVLFHFDQPLIGA